MAGDEWAGNLTEDEHGAVEAAIWDGHAAMGRAYDDEDVQQALRWASDARESKAHTLNRKLFELVISSGDNDRLLMLRVGHETFVYFRAALGGSTPEARAIRVQEERPALHAQFEPAFDDPDPTQGKPLPPVRLP